MNKKTINTFFLLFVISLITFNCSYSGKYHGVHQLREFIPEKNAKDIAGIKNWDLELFTATRLNNFKKAKKAIEMGADVNEKTKMGIEAMHVAAYYQSSPLIVDLLLKNGADVNAKDNKGRSILNYASYRGNKNLIPILIKNKVNINSKDRMGISPLHMASIHNKVEVVKILLNNGANVNISDNYRWTPLHWAVREGHKDVIKLLMSKDADFQIKNSDGNIPIQLTKSKEIRNLFK